eukprot:TRINITY_DN1844_c0_g1_i2.p1 TRINITY_DN1844_c0_g1~~TRINITY_DN1844_c0_g1_i2.p1  ORF type:complete len:262 (-),score=49.55 TRINITY_DN1844_c0_g1_i2:25-810(-)
MLTRSMQLFFGLFCGNRGPFCADYYFRNFHTYCSHICGSILLFYVVGLFLTHVSALLKNHHFPENLPIAFNETYEEVDTHFLNLVRTVSDEHLFSGCAALCSILWKDVLCVSYVGDVSAILKRGNNIEVLSDGKLIIGDNDEEEILLADPVGRGLGSLDYKSKDLESSNAITEQPKIEIVPLSNDCRWMLIGSWGFWDYISPQEADDLITRMLVQEENQEPEERGRFLYTVCIELIAKCSENGSDSCVSCVLVEFKSNNFI